MWVKRKSQPGKGKKNFGGQKKTGGKTTDSGEKEKWAIKKIEKSVHGGSEKMKMTGVNLCMRQIRPPDGALQIVQNDGGGEQGKK